MPPPKKPDRSRTPKRRASETLMPGYERASGQPVGRRRGAVEVPDEVRARPSRGQGKNKQRGGCGDDDDDDDDDDRQPGTSQSRGRPQVAAGPSRKERGRGRGSTRAGKRPRPPGNPGPGRRTMDSFLVALPDPDTASELESSLAQTRRRRRRNNSPTRREKKRKRDILESPFNSPASTTISVGLLSDDRHTLTVCILRFYLRVYILHCPSELRVCWGGHTAAIQGKKKANGTLSGQDLISWEDEIPRRISWTADPVLFFFLAR